MSTSCSTLVVCNSRRPIMRKQVREIIVCPYETGCIFFRPEHNSWLETLTQIIVYINWAVSKRLSTEEPMKSHFQVRLFALNDCIYNNEHSLDSWHFSISKYYFSHASNPAPLSDSTSPFLFEVLKPNILFTGTYRWYFVSFACDTGFVLHCADFTCGMYCVTFAVLRGLWLSHYDMTVLWC